jgi:hypothetical protein
MLEDKKHWAKVNRRAQTMLLLAGLRWVIVPHVKLEFSHFVYYNLIFPSLVDTPKSL